MRVPIMLMLVAVSACTKKTEPTQPQPVAKPNVAEVEFTGEWKSNIEAATYFFVAQDRPCRPFTATVATFGATALPKQGALFAEFFVPQGSLGHACIFAKDAAGKIVGIAAYDKNPIMMQGTGEIVVGPVNLVVEAP